MTNSGAEMTNERVLVTGGTGFVGRHVLRALDARGIPVRAVIRTGSASRLPDAFAISMSVKAAISSPKRPGGGRPHARAFSKVVHLAWVATPGVYLTAPENLDCLQGTLALAKGAAGAGVAKFLGTGTCFEYALGSGVLSTETPLHPSTPYAGAKAAAFLALSQWLPSQGRRIPLDAAVLSPWRGRRSAPPRTVSAKAACRRAARRSDKRAGEIRDFLDVSEAAGQLVDALYSNAEGAFNLCSGVPVTVRQLAERIADEYGRRDLLNFGARPDNLVDPVCVLGIPGQATGAA